MGGPGGETGLVRRNKMYVHVRFYSHLVGRGAAVGVRPSVGQVLGPHAGCVLWGDKYGD